MTTAVPTPAPAPPVPGRRILFVYNADSGLLAGVLDLLHKTVSPATYPCRLCQLSFGPLGMKRQWRAAVGALETPVAFLHRDEFAEPAIALPAILMEEGGKLTTLLGPADFAATDSLDALLSAFAAACARHGIR